jgi:predicted patatin/cPLA2 family phospholipase
MRGIFSAGVLDVLHEQRFNPFGFAIGCSAGACNLASHLAGHHGRNRRCYTTQMARPEFVSGLRFLRGGHWMDLDYLWDAFLREDPLDVGKALSSPTQLVVVATAVATGQPTFIEPRVHDLLDVLRASCAVPVLYRGFVTLGGHAYTDGGASAPIPVDEALRRGARRIMVVRSRPSSYVKSGRLENWFGSIALRSRPALARAIRGAPEVYQRARQLIARPPAGTTIVEVAPPRPLRTGRTTRDLGSLEEDYAVGRRAGLEAIQRCASWA